MICVNVTSLYSNIKHWHGQGILDPAASWEGSEISIKYESVCCCLRNSQTWEWLRSPSECEEWKSGTWLWTWLSGLKSNPDHNTLFRGNNFSFVTVPDHSSWVRHLALVDMWRKTSVKCEEISRISADQAIAPRKWQQLICTIAWWWCHQCYQDHLLQTSYHMSQVQQVKPWTHYHMPSNCSQSIPICRYPCCDIRLRGEGQEKSDDSVQSDVTSVQSPHTGTTRLLYLAQAWVNMFPTLPAQQLTCSSQGAVFCSIGPELSDLG